MAQTPWWQSAVIYQIYPKAFRIPAPVAPGDPQIMARLDYLKTLGVDALADPGLRLPRWTTARHRRLPGHRSRLRHHGRFRGAAGAAHARHPHRDGHVVNITPPPSTPGSSRRWGQNSPHRDYYIWKDPVDGGAQQLAIQVWRQRLGAGSGHRPVLPAPLRPRAGGSQLGKPAVRAEVKTSSISGEEGVDGFRLDVINPSPRIRHSLTTRWGWPPLLHRRAAHPRILQDVSRDVFRPSWAMTVGDVFHQPGALPALWRAGWLRAPWCSTSITRRWITPTATSGPRPVPIPRTQAHLQPLAERHAWQGVVGAVLVQPRSAAHRLPLLAMRASIGGRRQNAGQHAARLQGTPTSIRGEIGMTNPSYQHIDDYQDVESRNIFAIKQAEGMSGPRSAILGAKSRTTPAPRCSGVPPPTPVSPAGRPGSKPAANYPRSTPRRRWPTRLGVLALSGSHRLRKAPHLHPGDYPGAADRAPVIWAYARRANGQTLLVVSNFYGEPTAFLPAEAGRGKGACCWQLPG